MNAYRENLVDRMIKIYGFENPIVIEFCKLCERSDWKDRELALLVLAHEADPVLGEE